MLRPFISAALILTLLGCPLLCGRGLAARGETHQPGHSAAAGCCPHCGHGPQGKPSEQPSRTPVKSGTCNCICGGAVVSAAVELPQLDLAHSLDCPAAEVLAAPGESPSAPGEFAFSREDALPSGRMLRALYSSLLC